MKGKSHLTKETAYHSAVSIPLVVEETVEGVLDADDTKAKKDFEEALLLV